MEFFFADLPFLVCPAEGQYSKQSSVTDNPSAAYDLHLNLFTHRHRSRSKQSIAIDSTDLPVSVLPDSIELSERPGLTPSDVESVLIQTTM